MFWKTYLDPFKDAYSFGLSIYFFFWGGIHDPCKSIAWPFVPWVFFSVHWRQRATLVGQREGRAIRVRWSDWWIQSPQEAEEKRQIGCCNAEIGCGSDEEGKTMEKNMEKCCCFSFSWLADSCFFFFFLGGGGGTGLPRFFFFKWCNVGDWAKFVLSWCP